MPASARELAFRTLLTWRDLGAPPFLPERGDPAWAEAAPRDRALAFDLLNGVLRQRATLDALIASQLKMPLERLDPGVRAVLWLGVYELLFHGSARAYAVVHSAVELAKRHGLARAGGLVNGVLRSITRLKPTVEIRHGLSPFTCPRGFATQFRFTQAVFPNPAADPVAHLATIYSHPRPLVEMLIAAHGEPVATDILLHDNQRPPILLRADGPMTPPLSAGLEPHEVSGFFVAAKGWNARVEKLVSAGDVSPQDPTAAKPMRALLPHLPSGPLRILELCAGLGTKTIQLGRALEAEARGQTSASSVEPGSRAKGQNAAEWQIVATDVDSSKLARLEQRAQVMGLGRIQAVPLAEATAVPGAYQVVLLDVPCSNTGVLGRRVQARWRWPTLDRPALARTQLGLLEQAAGLLVPGGRILYSTCSIDPLENQDVAERFLAAHPAFTRLSEELTLPAASDNPSMYHDGGYYTVLATP